MRIKQLWLLTVKIVIPKNPLSGVQQRTGVDLQYVYYF